MAELAGRVGYLKEQSQREPALYPLQPHFLAWGLLAALFGGAIFFSPLVGFAFLVLFGTAGAVWRRDETPALAFCIAFQWLFVVTGYLYKQAFGSYPGLAILGDLEGAVFLSLVGFIVLAIGIRAGFRPLEHYLIPAYKRRESMPRYDVRKLFWLLIVLTTVNWFVTLNPMLISFNAAQIIDNVLAFRSVLRFLLFLVVIQQREGYRYAVAILAYTIIPNLGSVGSVIVGALIPVLLALLSEWRPWSGATPVRWRSKRLVRIAVGIAVVVVAMGLIWQGGLKAAWRHQVRPDLVGRPPIEMAQEFIATAQRVVPQIDMQYALRSSAARLSSSAGYFSIVLDRVPELIPYEEGRLTMRALKHITRPRFLFPDKPNLGGDSWMIWEYVGIPVAGAEQGTSIGLTYMAEFYIDYGIPGMFLPLFFLGCILGLLYQILYHFSPSYNFFRSTTMILFASHFTTYGAEIAKLLGGLLMKAAIFCAILYVIGPWLHRKLAKDDDVTTSLHTKSSVTEPHSDLPAGKFKARPL